MNIYILSLYLSVTVFLCVWDKSEISEEWLLGFITKMKGIWTINSNALSGNRIVFLNGLSVILGRAISWFVVLRNLIESDTPMVRFTHKDEVCQLRDNKCHSFCTVSGRSCMLKIFTNFEALNRLLNLSLLNGDNNNK